MKAMPAVFLVSLMVLFGASRLDARTIKLGSIAPEGSPWDTAVKKIASEWRKISGGSIDMKIYPGGIVGSEPDMIRKMRIGQLQAAVFTGVGMSYITPEVFSLSLPFFIQNEEELDYMMKKMAPHFESLIEKKGFVVVVWSKAGWVNFFSTKPVVYPADLKKLKLSVSEADPDMLQAWRVMGYNAVPISTNDAMTALQNGMIEAFYSPPLVSAAFQWFGIAKYMCSIRIAPMIGGIVVSKKTWDQIPKDMKPKLRQSARKIVAGLNTDAIALEKNAINTMLKHGLVIKNVPPDAAALWKKEAEKGHRVYVGKTFPKELYDRMKKYLADFRRKK